MDRQNYQLQWSSKDLGSETIIDIGNIKEMAAIIAAGVSLEEPQEMAAYTCFSILGAHIIK